MQEYILTCALGNSVISLRETKANSLGKKWDSLPINRF